eukprot:gnl/Dysnectes_brevis/8254_a14535_298.p1 GENE.gnl/Dysnectes_brevis/8254_a14535_298~~gnl/Dysnectes_brevis/8254_a14535_298.p1  ORF type:complete len:302 (-),score=13.51 gnl/Dysnectes_brevis/8254_a14535_298:63-968(-)
MSNLTLRLITERDRSSSITQEQHSPHSTRTNNPYNHSVIYRTLYKPYSILYKKSRTTDSYAPAVRTLFSVVFIAQQASLTPLLAQGTPRETFMFTVPFVVSSAFVLYNAGSISPVGLHITSSLVSYLFLLIPLTAFVVLVLALIHCSGIGNGIMTAVGHTVLYLLLVPTLSQTPRDKAGSISLRILPVIISALFVSPVMATAHDQIIPEGNRHTAPCLSILPALTSAWLIHSFKLGGRRTLRVSLWCLSAVLESGLTVLCLRAFKEPLGVGPEMGLVGIALNYFVLLPFEFWDGLIKEDGY